MKSAALPDLRPLREWLSEHKSAIRVDPGATDLAQAAALLAEDLGFDK